MSDLETRIQQIAQVLGQLDDTQVPRNIRSAAKDAVDKWLLNKNKDMDIRLGMTASTLDDILMIQISLVTMAHFAFKYKPLWKHYLQK